MFDDLPQQETVQLIQVPMLSGKELDLVQEDEVGSSLNDEVANRTKG